MMTADAVWYKLVQVTACPVIFCIQMSFSYQIRLNLVVNSRAGLLLETTKNSS